MLEGFHKAILSRFIQALHTVDMPSKLFLRTHFKKLFSFTCLSTRSPVIAFEKRFTSTMKREKIAFEDSILSAVRD